MGLNCEFFPKNRMVQNTWRFWRLTDEFVNIMETIIKPVKNRMTKPQESYIME